MTHRILFVCLGNICRSPSAEAVTRVLSHKRGVNVVLDSAGTDHWHVGEPPYPPMRKVAEARGYPMSDLRARAFETGDFARFDLILAMDQSNLRRMQDMSPDGATAALRMFTSYLPETEAFDVPDPYYTRDFDGVLDVIERGAEALLRGLQTR